MPSLFALIEQASAIYGRMEDARTGANLSALATSLYLPPLLNTKKHKLDAIMALVSKANPSSDLSAEQLATLNNDELTQPSEGVLSLRIAALKADEAVSNPNCVKLKSLVELLSLCAQAYGRDMHVAAAKESLKTCAKAYNEAFAGQIDIEFLLNIHEFLSEVQIQEHLETIKTLEKNRDGFKSSFNTMVQDIKSFNEEIASLKTAKEKLISENTQLRLKNDNLASQNKTLTEAILSTNTESGGLSIPSLQTTSSTLRKPNSSPSYTLGNSMFSPLRALNVIGLGRNSPETPSSCATETRNDEANTSKRGCQEYGKSNRSTVKST